MHACSTPRAQSRSRLCGSDSRRQVLVCRAKRQQHSNTAASLEQHRSNENLQARGRQFPPGPAFAVGLAGLLLCCQPSQAAPLPQQRLVLLDTNAAIVSQLKQIQQTKQKFGTQDPGSALAARFAGAQQQLQRIELLVKIQQYDNARMQLRQGSFKSLRSDLRYEAEYRGVEPELARNIVEGVERLDRQLRGQEAMDTIGQGVKQLQAQLQQLVDAAQPSQ